MPLFISRCDHPRKHYVNLISIYIMLMMPYSKKVTFSEQNHGLIKSVLMSPVVLTPFFFFFFGQGNRCCGVDVIEGPLPPLQGRTPSSMT